MLLILVAYLIIFIFLILSLYLKRMGVKTRIIRDITHIAGGIWAPFLKYIGSIKVILLTGIPVILVLLVIEVADIRFIKDLYTNKEERFYGLILYALSLTFIPLLFWDRRDIASTSILILALGDGAASLIGREFGNHFFKTPFSQIKTLEGSFSMFILSFLILLNFNGYLFALFIGIFITLIEALSPPHLDNLILPFISAGILSFFYG